jgi:energy-coupling factor transport system ATP-binding protein
VDEREGSPDAVRAEGLSFRHLLDTEPTLRDVSLRISPGERVVVLGPSGSGKSTMAKLLNGLIPRSVAGERSGTLRVLAEDPAELGPARLATRVGIVFQNPESQFCTLRVDDEVAFGLENLGIPREEIAAKMAWALQSVGMWADRKRRLDRLSGGMKQRVAVAAVMAMEPELLILDEPTAHMDPVGTRSVAELIKGLAHERPRQTVMLIEHRLDAWMEMADRLLVLRAEGTVAADGPPREVYGPKLGEGVWKPSTVSAGEYAREQGSLTGDTPLLPSELVALAGDDSGIRNALVQWAAAGGPAEPRARKGSALLAFERAGYVYPDGTEALRGVTAEALPGEILGVVGNNGSGKTTLAELGIGMRVPTAGRVSLGGRDAARLSPRALAEHAGFVFQNPEHQFVADSVYDEVAFGLRRLGVGPEAREEQVRSMLAAFSLLEKQRANPFELSQGEKRRLSVATMLVMSPRLLFLDEPTFGQDVETAGELALRFRNMADSGMGLVLISHDLDLLWRIADRVLLLHEGRLLRSGNAREVLADADVMREAGLEIPFPAWLLQELGAS